MIHSRSLTSSRITVVQLRNAFALASILNRTLILPPLWCGLDRYWAPHAGTLPGSEFKLPFICPADHVLDLESKSCNPDYFSLHFRDWAQQWHWLCKEERALDKCL